jgi:anti-sigma factor (TIGR02949 family)
MSACRRVVTLLDAYADGELEPEHVLEMEAHLADCNGCSSRLQLEHAMKKSLRRQVHAEAQPSDAFRDRILASISAEAEREAVGNLESSQRGAMLSWSSIVPLAAAAAMALFWSSHTDKSVKPDSPRPESKQASILNVEQLLNDIVDRHVERSKPDVTEPALLDGMEPDVGVPVHFPSLAQYGARWQGGRIVPFRNPNNEKASLNAASLKFLVDGHRVTVYVYNSERVALGSPLQRRVVRNEPVYTGWKRGYSIATADHHGVGYAVATDLGEDEGAEIVASLH